MPFLSQVERGLSRPTVADLTAIGEALDCIERQALKRKTRARRYFSISFQISTCFVSGKSNEPTTKVSAATAIG